MQNKFKSFEDAKNLVHSLNLNSKKEWDEYCKGGKKPSDVPTNAYRVYKGKGWESWGEFLGTGMISTRQKEFRLYEEAKEFVHTLKLKTIKDWYNYCKSGNKPEDIPSSPNATYKNKGWINYAYWLGTKKIPARDLVKSAKEESEVFKRLLSLKSNKEFNEFMKLRSKKKKK
jgi:hypothetical protein